ncbi:MAG: N-formylglutamate deformylase [Burkholderiaceae bacterium]
MTDHPAFHLTRGTTPLLVSLPHSGELIPDDLRDAYVPRALALEDTDWHLQRLYAFAEGLGASVLRPRVSRYVIDLNRPPDDAPMYPGANNTELCPTRFFTGDPLYREGRAPDAAEIARRTAQWWLPYHRALMAELERLRAAHGHAVLFDGHSIRSELPWLFEGKLPALNLGTVNGASCAASLRAALAGMLELQRRHSHVVDGRFKGGYITRHYGRPEEGLHAVQLEMTWACYMDEAPPYAYREDRADEVLPTLRELLTIMRDWKPASEGLQ